MGDSVNIYNKQNDTVYKYPRKVVLFRGPMNADVVLGFLPPPTRVIFIYI